MLATYGLMDVKTEPSGIPYRALDSHTRPSPRAPAACYQTLISQHWLAGQPYI